MIYIRRFRCRFCRKTVSLLPSFAQPYRLIQNRTFAFYVDNTHQKETSRWETLLRPYWRCFCQWSKNLMIALSGAWGALSTGQFTHWVVALARYILRRF